MNITMRAIAVTFMVSAIFAFICALILNGGNVNSATMFNCVTLGVAFASAVVISAEFLPFLYSAKYPSVGIIRFMALGMLAYVFISKSLGGALFSASMGDGIFGCVFFTGFFGVLLYTAVIEDEDVPLFLICGMLAGFMFQPILAAAGYVAEPNLERAFLGAIAGGVIGFVYFCAVKHQVGKFLKRRTIQ